MSDPYHYRKQFLENSPDPSSDGDSKRVQPFGGYQDHSVHQNHQDPTQQRYHQHYPEQYQHQFQQQYQQSYQTSVQDQSRLINPAQYQSRPPDQYTAQQQAQLLHAYPIQDPNEDPHEYSQDFRGGYQGQDSRRKSVEYTIEQPLEDTNRYVHPVPNAHRPYGGYQTGVTAPVTGVLGSPSLTSMDSRSGLSQADATFQAEGTWIPSHGLQNPASPNLVSNEIDPVEKPVTGYQDPAQWAELTLSPGQEQEVRECIARGEHLDEMARQADRPAPLIQHFIASNSLMWTELQDEELIALVGQGCSTPAILESLGHLGGPRRFDYEVEARARYLLPGGGSAQRADLAGDILHDFHKDPVIYEPERSASPYPSQQVGSKTRSAPKRWGHKEVRRLGDSVPRNNYIWEDISKEFPGRSADAVRRKWRAFYGFDKGADKGAQISSTPHGQQRGREEGRVVSRPFRERSTRARHQWRDKDDDRLKGEVARGLSCAKMASMGFLGLSFNQIRRRAAAIEAFWTREDDVNLFHMKLKPHPEFDWNLIGQKLIPERKGFVVKERWEFLQRRARGEDIEEEDVEEEGVEEEDVEEEYDEDEGLEGDNIDYYI